MLFSREWEYDGRGGREASWLEWEMEEGKDILEGSPCRVLPVWSISHHRRYWHSLLMLVAECLSQSPAFSPAPADL